MRALFLVPASLLALASSALAQAPGPADTPAPAPVAPAAPAPPNTIVTQGPGGSVIVAPSGPDPNAGLPSSSRPKVGNESDTFDFRAGGSGDAVVHNPGGSAVISESGTKIRGLTPPSIHLVKRGDNLWDLLQM
jgi:nucleoid-associated protein YgaU